jgi:hypothetical protein
MATTFQASAEGYTIQADVTVIGKDLLITITGGDSPHIGTVTWANKDTASETKRFPSHHGRFHKDDVLSQAILEQIQAKLPGNCVLTAGVHVNGITKEQINVSFKLAKQIGQDILAWMETADFSTDEVIYANYTHTDEG